MLFYLGSVRIRTRTEGEMATREEEVEEVNLGMSLGLRYVWWVALATTTL